MSKDVSRAAPCLDVPARAVRRPGDATGQQIGDQAVLAGPVRLASLDGLRGLAAAVVVVHHCVLALPSLANQLNGPDRSSPAFWLTYTPVHLLWAGGEAVLLFFVLSGLVLALPYLSRSRTRWSAYYAKRVLRLYIPVAVAVALAAVVVRFVPRTPRDGWSWWMQAHAVAPGPSDLLHEAFLLDGTGWLNSALWSLRYEVCFSLLLPLFVVGVARLRPPLVLSVAAALWGVGWAVSIGHDLLSYLFVFLVGVLLAQHLDTLQRFADWMSSRTAAPCAWFALAALGTALLLSEWWAKLLIQDWTLWLPLGRPGGVLGAAVVVVCFVHCPFLRSVGSSRPVQWLGVVSFSLYLVHEPIVVSIATMNAPTPRGVAITLAVGSVASLLAAVVFRRLVERPSHRLASWVGGLVTRSSRSVGGSSPVVLHPSEPRTVELSAQPRLTPVSPVVAGSAGEPARDAVLVGG